MTTPEYCDRHCNSSVSFNGDHSFSVVTVRRHACLPCSCIWWAWWHLNNIFPLVIMLLDPCGCTIFHIQTIYPVTGPSQNKHCEKFFVIETLKVSLFSSYRKLRSLGVLNMLQVHTSDDNAEEFYTLLSISL